MGKHSGQTPWSDEKLVRECVEGNEEAWGILVEKYKRLVYSIPLKCGFAPDEATDIFQEVFLELISHLPRLREAKALPKWIIQTTSHKCFHRNRQRMRYTAEDPERDERADPASLQIPNEALAEWEREQKLQETLETLPPRCRQLIQMLFYEQPSRPYAEIAQSLGIATGSVGFIRGRCLEKLRSGLEKMGFR